MNVSRQKWPIAPGTYRRIPLAPHQMTERVTRTNDLFVLVHLGIPSIAESAWRLDIGGLVDRSFSLDFDDLKRLPRVEIESFHQCAGDPTDPTSAKRRVQATIPRPGRSTTVFGDP
jgi:sulfane dehydrogenase subunit SoxC